MPYRYPSASITALRFFPISPIFVTNSFNLVTCLRICVSLHSTRKPCLNRKSKTYSGKSVICSVLSEITTVMLLRLWHVAICSSVYIRIVHALTWYVLSGLCGYIIFTLSLGLLSYQLRYGELSNRVEKDRSRNRSTIYRT